MIFDFIKKFFRKDNSGQPKVQAKSKRNNPKPSFLEESRQQSMKDSQGVNDFSGSSYKGPGNVDHEKRNSNMSQRNF